MNDHSSAKGRAGAISGASVIHTPLACFNKSEQFFDVPLLHSVESSLMPTSPIYAL